MTAVHSCARFSDLPKIGNGRLIATKEPSPFIGTTSTSLPPLTKYHVSGLPRRRWGEDESLKPLVAHGLSKYGCNFDACHPVSEGPEVRYEGYMTPKALRHDLGTIHTPVINTGRRVPRQLTCEVFPRSNINRISNIDGRHVLGETTRRSTEDYFSILYKTTHYDNIYRDTSKHMLDRLARDVQYYREGPNYVEAPTCTRVHNHADPCHHCWTGGYNRDFDLKLAESQAKLPGLSTHIHVGSKFETNFTCKLCQEAENNDKRGTDDKKSTEGVVEKGLTEESCSSCGRRKDSKVQEQIQTEGSNVTNIIENSDGTYNDMGMEFGPWMDSIAKDKDESLLLRKSYQFKLPSSLHCRGTENDLAANFQYRHGGLNYGYMFPKPWESLCRQKVNQPPPGRPKAVTFQDEVSRMDLQESTKNSRNTWTFRDENNIRKPCIADVLGNFNKSDAHKRYHDQHRDPVPDVRDNAIYSKRVQFYGYNSSVYR